MKCKVCEGRKWLTIPRSRNLYGDLCPRWCKRKKCMAVLGGADRCWCDHCHGTGKEPQKKKK